MHERNGFALCLVLLLVATSAWADEVRLKNGDRYTGKAVALDRGTLKFDTGHGTLDLPWADVTSLSVPAPVVVTVGGREQTAAVAAAADGQATIGAATVALADITALRLPQPPRTMIGGANAGFLSTGGNTDVNSLRIDGELVVRAQANRYTGSGQVNRAVDSGRETARNATGAFRYDRFVSRQLYFNGSAIFTNDRFRDLDLRTALGVGVGYQVVDNVRAKLGVEGGYGYVNERFATQPDDSYHAAHEAVAVDVFVIGKRLVVFHRNDGFFGFTGEDNLFVQTRNGVRVGLAAGLVTTLQYDVDYDKSPAPGRKTTDRALGLTFGYRF
jgi:putative salt-induced outer membrane protein YdiY